MRVGPAELLIQARALERWGAQPDRWRWLPTLRSGSAAPRLCQGPPLAGVYPLPALALVTMTASRGKQLVGCAKRVAAEGVKDAVHHQGDDPAIDVGYGRHIRARREGDMRMGLAR